MNVSLVLLCSFFQIVLTANDDECEVNYNCTFRDECIWYQKKLNQIKKERNAKIKQDIFQDLRSLVCNRTEKKICCPMM